jgi:epsilon-lactone hydrolase
MGIGWIVPLGPLGLAVFRFIRLMWVTLWVTTWRRLRRGPRRPSWSFSFELTQALMRRDWEETADWDLPKLRHDMDRRLYPSPSLRRVQVKDESVQGIFARWFIPSGAPEDRVVFYLHGGSNVYGSVRTTHTEMIARMALESGLTFVGIDYRLAPEHPYPAQLEDAAEALSAIRKRYKHVAVAGDSSGGNLALALEIHLRDRSEPQFCAAVLISPWSDLTMPGESFQRNDPYDFGRRQELVRHARAFAGELDLSDPRISPTNASLANLPPTLVVVGQLEIPHDDILLLTKRLSAAGTSTLVHEALDMPHCPPAYAAFHPAGEECVREIARFLRGKFEGL